MYWDWSVAQTLVKPISHHRKGRWTPKSLDRPRHEKIEFDDCLNFSSESSKIQQPPKERDTVDWRLGLNWVPPEVSADSGYETSRKMSYFTHLHLQGRTRGERKKKKTAWNNSSKHSHSQTFNRPPKTLNANHKYPLPYSSRNIPYFKLVLH